MLNRDDQERLEAIASQCWHDDARFARGMRDGKPTSPREYRRPLIVALGAFGSTTFFVGFVTLLFPLVFAGLIACVVAATFYVCRGVDTPHRKGDRHD